MFCSFSPPRAVKKKSMEYNTLPRRPQAALSTPVSLSLSVFHSCIFLGSSRIRTKSLLWCQILLSLQMTEELIKKGTKAAGDFKDFNWKSDLLWLQIHSLFRKLSLFHLAFLLSFSGTNFRPRPVGVKLERRVCLLALSPARPLNGPAPRDAARRSAINMSRESLHRSWAVAKGTTFIAPVTHQLICLTPLTK